VVASSGGAVFEAMQRILADVHPGRVEWLVVTDRPCGIEDICRERQICHARILEPDNARFSAAAKQFFDDSGGVDFVLLFFLRLVTEELFLQYPTFNIHPSLLPAFQGFNPIRKALRQRVRYLGATLHLAASDADCGPIVAQACMSISSDDDEARLNKNSYIQKVGLGLLLYQMIHSGSLQMNSSLTDFEIDAQPVSDRLNPALTDPALFKALLSLQEAENVEVFL